MRAAASTISEAAAGRGGMGGTGATPPPSFHALSAGKINVAT
jgi:hypothetical protein